MLNISSIYQPTRTRQIRCIDDRKKLEGNVVVYNAAITSCEKSSHWEGALRLLAMMQVPSGRKQIMSSDSDNELT